MNAKRRPEAELQPAENVPCETSPHALDEYRAAVTSLKDAAEHLAGLQEVQERLLAEQARAEVDRERLLDESAAAADNDAQSIEELSRASAKSEVLTRRLAKMAVEVAGAQEQVANEQSRLSVSLSRLWHAFYQWKLEQAKTLISDQLVPGVANHILELVAWHHKSLSPIRAWEIPLSLDASALVRASGTLLEGVSAEPAFVVPPFTLPAPTAPAAVDPLWTPGVPWGDRGVDVDAEIRAMHQADPTLTLPRAMRLLYEKFPHIFTAPKEGALSLNEPLPKMKDMVGSTYVPEEPAAEEFSHA